MSIKDFREKQVVFVFVMNGETIHFKNDNIVVLNKDDSVKFQTTCYLLFALFIIGTTSVTTTIINHAKRFDFSLVFMNQNLRVITIINSKAEGNIILRKQQYSHSGDSLGALIIRNKIENQQIVLKSIRKKDCVIRNAIDNIDKYKEEVLESGISCQKIMGIEGSSSRVYFQALFNECNWTARRPRIKHDEINCLMDIGYTMLFNLVNGLLELYGFDTYVGVLHRPFFHRKSLSCDIVEPFRPIIDRAIRKAYNLGQIKKEDFYIHQNQYNLLGKKAIPYLKLLLASLMEYKDPLFEYIQLYYRAFVRNVVLSEYPVFNLGDYL